MAGRDRGGGSHQGRGRTRRLATKPRQFVEVYDDCIGRVYGFFGYRVGSRELAEDLTQQTFERAGHGRTDVGGDEPQPLVTGAVMCLRGNACTDERHRRGGKAAEDPPNAFHRPFDRVRWTKGPCNALSLAGC